MYYVKRYVIKRLFQDTVAGYLLGSNKVKVRGETRTLSATHYQLKPNLTQVGRDGLIQFTSDWRLRREQNIQLLKQVD